MAADTNWVSILGAVSGVSALIIWLASLIINTVRKPKLQISSKPYARLWEIEDALTGVKHTWNFVNFEVKNKKGLALGCEAKAIVAKHPNNVSLVQELTKDGYGIHWADISYSGRSTSVERIDIGSVTQRLDVVLLHQIKVGNHF